MACHPEVGQPEFVDAQPRQKAALRKSRCFYLDVSHSHLLVDKNWTAGLKTCWSIPMDASGRLRGVMQFAFRKDYLWLPRELDLLMASAERCSMAADKAELIQDLSIREDQVRRLAEHMVEVEEAERRRISRELHDEAGQSLLCVRLHLEMLEQDLAGADEAMKSRLVELREMTEHTIVEIRRLIAALSPAILEQMGLAAALRQLAARFRRLCPAVVRVDLPRRLELPTKLEIIVYRLVQEVFHNIAKYSLASHVNLSLGSADGVLRLHVEDDGVGFDVAEAFSRRDCFGLSGIRERVALMGGTLMVNSLPKAAVKLPVKRTGSANSNLSGVIGIERHGTAIRIELPVKVRISPAVPAGTRGSGLQESRPRVGG
jgi:signal transduction histidine kinase